MPPAQCYRPKTSARHPHHLRHRHNDRASHSRHPGVFSRDPVAPTDPGAPCRPGHPRIPSPRSTPPFPNHQPPSTWHSSSGGVHFPGKSSNPLPNALRLARALLSLLLPLIHLVPPAARRFTRPSTRREPAKPHSSFQAPVPNRPTPLHHPAHPAQLRVVTSRGPGSLPPCPGSRTLQTRSAKRAKAHARRPGFPSGEAGPAGVCSPQRPRPRPLPARHAAGNQHQVSSPRAPPPAPNHPRRTPPVIPTSAESLP